MTVETVLQPSEKWSIRSFCTFPYWTPYDTQSYSILLDEIKTKFGKAVNFIEVRLNWDVDPEDPDNVLYFDNNGQNSYEALEVAITKAHQKGFKVILGVVKGWQTSVLNVSDWALWWNNYRRLIVEFAQFAQRLNVEVFIMGWEYGGLDEQFENGGFNEEWKTTIAKIRQVYSGKLTYEPNWVYTFQGMQNLLNNAFLGDLDFIAMSTYWGVTENWDAGLAEMLQGW